MAPFRPRVIAWSTVVTLCALAACGKSQSTTPSPPAVTTAAQLTVTPVSPANGAHVALTTDPTPLVFANAGVPAGALVVNTVEVATDPNFVNRVVVTSVPPDPGGQTTVPAAGLKVGTTYFWRVQAATSGASTATTGSQIFVADAAGALATPTPVSPVSGSVVTLRPFLNATSVVPIGAGVLKYRFQVATDSAFAAILETFESFGANGQPTKNLPGGTIYWRVQAVDTTSGQASGFSATQHFDVAAPFVQAPTLVSPANGVSVFGRPPFLVMPGAHSGQPSNVAYTVQVASTPDFAKPTHCTYQTLSSDAPFACVWDFDQAPGTYYWRASASIGGTDPATHQDFRAQSGVSEVRSFVLVESLQEPARMQPASGSVVLPIPTFVVSNAVRSGAAGAIAYRFEVGTDSELAPASIILSATVPEGAGQTSWVPNRDLPPGIRFYWRATAIDTTNGLVSTQRTNASPFTVLASPPSNMRLDLTDPGPQSCSGQPVAKTYHIPGVVSRDTSGAVTFVSLDSLRLDLVALGTSLSGALSGRGSLGGGLVLETGDNTSGIDRVPFSGSAGADGAMTGTFNGTIRIENTFGDGGFHDVCGGTWALR